LPRVLSTSDISDFRERLCDAAEKLFAEHGLEAVTMRQLAGELGVSPMTPYRYFADKDAILAAVRARAFDRHAEALESAYRNASGDLNDRANAAGQAYLSFAFENPEAYKLMFDVRQPTETDYPDLMRAQSRSRATMTAYLEALQAAGLFHGDVELTGLMFWAALHGPIMLQLSGMLSKRFDAATVSRAIMIAMQATVFPDLDPA
jgi:AcrR family transcriptional regulator